MLQVDHYSQGYGVKGAYNTKKVKATAHGDGHGDGHGCDHGGGGPVKTRLP